MTLRALLRWLYGDMTPARVEELSAKWERESRVPCPECGNGTPWAHVARTGRCAFGHEMRSLIVKGGEA